MAFRWGGVVDCIDLNTQIYKVLPLFQSLTLTEFCGILLIINVL